MLQPLMSLCMAVSSGGVFYLSPASDELRNLWLAPVAASLFSLVYTFVVMRPEIKILLEKDVITKKGRNGTYIHVQVSFKYTLYIFNLLNVILIYACGGDNCNVCPCSVDRKSVGEGGRGTVDHPPLHPGSRRLDCIFAGSLRYCEILNL